MVKMELNELRIKNEDMKSKMAFQSNSYTICPRRFLPPPAADFFPHPFRGRVKDRPWVIGPLLLSLSLSPSSNHHHSLGFSLFFSFFFSHFIYDRSPQCPSVMTYG